MALQPVKFAGQRAENEIDERLLSNAYAEWRDCVQNYINEGDVALICVDYEGDAREEELERVMTDTAERVASAADPGMGRDATRMTIDIDRIYYWAKEEMEKRIDAVREAYE